jgi:CelD/BcsL family acetyltransferase involved in cellulose biosynthesis
VTASGDVDAAMRDVLEIERNSWKQDQGSSFTADGSVARFYANLARACAGRGWLRLHLLYLDGQPVAHVFGVRHGKSFLALKTSYDRRFRSASPGVGLMLEAVERAFGEGAAMVEFLGDEARWKAEFATEYRLSTNLFVFSGGIPDWRMGAFWEGHLKPFVRNHAPGLVGLKSRLRQRIKGDRA